MTKGKLSENINMADRGRSSRSRTRVQVPWDSTNPANWTASKLQSELELMDIIVPVSLGKNTLRKIYQENLTRRQNRPNINNVQIGPTMQESNEIDPINDSVNNANVSESDGPHEIAPSNSTSSQQSSATVTHVPRMNTACAVTGNNMADKTIINSMLNSMQTMQQTMMGLQQTVLKIVNDKSQSNTDDNNLASAYAAMNAGTQQQHCQQSQLTPVTDNFVQTGNGGYRFPRSEFGIPSECIPHIDVVPDNIKKRIWEGKDINLATLLIPKNDTSHSNQEQVQNQGGIVCHVNLNTQEDSRLHKSLSISEFITAFGKYKRVMCMKFPERRVELDRYEANIIDISNVYGHKFYDYHCQFSAKAASALRDYNIKVDWAIRDLALLNMVASNAKVNSCNLCNSTMHYSAFCPRLNTANQQNGFGNNRNMGYRDADKYGRKRIVVNDRELCNNFNERKCIRAVCNYAHICSTCYSTQHGSVMCPKKKVTPKQNNHEGGNTK